MKNRTTAIGHESYGCEARSVVVTSAPATEPVTTATAKAHIQIASGNTADDTLVDALVATARAWVEQSTGLRLVTQTIVARYDAVPDAGAPLLLPCGPLQSVTSIKYFEIDNASPTAATGTLSATAYLVDPYSPLPRIALHDGQTWPDDLRAVNALEVTAIVGYGTATAVPGPILHALLMLAAFLYDQRSSIGIDPGLTIAEMPFGPRALLGPYRLAWV
jgi:uncharacterized phiE125 gp8 family phage protein